jgi:hypothetical protein
MTNEMDKDVPASDTRHLVEDDLHYNDLFRIFGRNTERDVVRIGNTTVTVKLMLLSMLILLLAINVQFRVSEKQPDKVISQPVSEQEESCSPHEAFQCGKENVVNMCSGGKWVTIVSCPSGTRCVEDDFECVPHW